MTIQLDKILIVDDDPEIRSLWREQVLDPKRFQVIEAQDGADALEKISRFDPDLVILDMIMPGLSGADFLVALKARGFTGPIIMVTKRGGEAQAIDCFRLGATDYLTKPIREAEALRSIDHGLQEVHLRRERKELLTRLQDSNKQLESRLKTLTTLSGVGKSVTGMLNLEQLFDRVLEAAIMIAESDHATLLLRDEESNRLLLRAGKNMTLVMQEKLGETVNDEVASLVMTSGEPLLVAGDALKRFRASADLQAVIYAPMSIQNKAIGVLTVGNHRKRRTFDENMPATIEILAGYAAIAIANARLFAALERRARNMEHAYHELQARDANREKIIAGVMSLRKAMDDLSTDIKRIGTNSMPSKIADRISSLNQRLNGLLESVGEIQQ